MAYPFFSNLIFRVISAYAENTPVTFKIRFPGGSERQNRPGTPNIIIIIKHWFSFVRLALLGAYGFATDYTKQRIDVEGDLRYLGYLWSYHSSLESHLKENIKSQIRKDTPLVYLMNRWHMLTHLAWSYKQARHNAEYHYGLHPEFYFNYLGPTGAYSSGFWYEDTRTWTIPSA